MIMSWSEAKKLSDVIRSNIVPSEFVFESWNYGSTTVSGNGIALYSMTGDKDSSKSAQTTITVDGKELESVLYLLQGNAYQAALIPFKESLQISQTGISSAQNTLSVLLFDREFIGGGQ